MERPVIELNHELQVRYGGSMELISLDTVEGSEAAELYGIMQYPSVIAIDSNGMLHKAWADGNLPLINEVSYYLQS